MAQVNGRLDLSTGPLSGPLASTGGSISNGFEDDEVALFNQIRQTVQHKIIDVSKLHDKLDSQSTRTDH